MPGRRVTGTPNIDCYTDHASGYVWACPVRFHCRILKLLCDRCFSSDTQLKNKGDQLRILMLLVLTQPKLEQSLLRDLTNKSKIGDPGKVCAVAIYVLVLLSS